MISQLIASLIVHVADIGQSFPSSPNFDYTPNQKIKIKIKIIVDGNHTTLTAIQYKAVDIWAIGVTSFYLLTQSKGFRTLRWQVAEDQTGKTTLPNGYDISAEGLEFVVQTTREIPTERLACAKAWVTEPGKALLHSPPEGR